jgi:D-alanine-D-alanine ligase
LSIYHEMLLEELIEGQEITVGVVLDKALPVIEIIPPADGEFDYDNKYNGKTQELCPPEDISNVTQEKAQQIAEKIHLSLGVKDFSRTDIMVRASDEKLFVLETNTIPGMTDQSLLPKAAAVAGLSMPQLCSELVEAALHRN